jgi:hypothetical protein
MQKILILNEKHDTRYFDVSTDELLVQVAYKILKERADAGYYYYEPKPLADRITGFNYAGLTNEEIGNLPDAIRAGAESNRHHELNQIDSITEEFKKESLFWELLQKVLELPKDEALTYKHKETLRTPTVLLLLNSRSENQYEGFEIEKIESV